ncbi:hypothetical protein ACQPZX_16610 [Actinoplanes sp. CA-142083]|uniref:hypothetical protein n=1 Tax=Actinoplanes sp. CA-142083 TaxID=3239903 RepID=UPI003D8C6180
MTTPENPQDLPEVPDTDEEPTSPTDIGEADPHPAEKPHSEAAGHGDPENIGRGNPL